MAEGLKSIGHPDERKLTKAFQGQSWRGIWIFGGGGVSWRMLSKWDKSKWDIFLKHLREQMWKKEKA